MTRAIIKINLNFFGQVFQKLWQYKCNVATFWHELIPNIVISRDSGNNLLFLKLKSYSPLNFRNSRQILWCFCIPNGSYEDNNLMADGICTFPPPPPPTPYLEIS